MSAPTHRAGLRPTLLTLAVLAALPAAAQQAPTAATATDLDKVTVKGEKTDRSLQDTASSVAVTTSARIEQENLLSLSDLINRTPNVTPMYGQRGFTIRGIADESGAPNPLATIYLDGAALPSQASDSLPTDLWDLSQVEIFRGPQSTIQGQNALAGAIVMRSEDPTMDWSGRARVLLSDPSDKRYAVAGGEPAGERRSWPSAWPPRSAISTATCGTRPARPARTRWRAPTPASNCCGRPRGCRA